MIFLKQAQYLVWRVFPALQNLFSDCVFTIARTCKIRYSVNNQMIWGKRVTKEWFILSLPRSFLWFKCFRWLYSPSVRVQIYATCVQRVGRRSGCGWSRSVLWQDNSKIYGVHERCRDTHLIPSLYYIYGVLGVLLTCQCALFPNRAPSAMNDPPRHILTTVQTQWPLCRVLLASQFAVRRTGSANFEGNGWDALPITQLLAAKWNWATKGLVYVHRSAMGEILRILGGYYPSEVYGTVVGWIRYVVKFIYLQGFKGLNLENWEYSIQFSIYICQ